ncbi:MAG: hypothetical protein RI897_3969 [Verrucomicrobiota bacterium]|jgi:flagella basal body P-ring formation protein FlgA
MKWNLCMLLIVVGLAGWLTGASPVLAGGDTDSAGGEVALRLVEEVELCQLVVDAVQLELGEVAEGELDLTLARPWQPVQVPEGSVEVRVLDLPRSGLRSYLLVRFELLAGGERVGAWHLTFRASLWREVPVARSNLQRGMRLVDADIVMERVDVLGVREPLGAGVLADPNMELAQYVKAGMPVTARAVRERPVIHRGAMVEASMGEGLLSITLKVQALEDAFSGQTFRVRNPQNRREYLAQVKDDRTVYLLL